MLLYLIKYSRPDLANVVRELSKCMDGAYWICIPHVRSILDLLFRLRIRKRIFYPLGISVRDSKSKFEE